MNNIRHIHSNVSLIFSIVKLYRPSRPHFIYLFNNNLIPMIKRSVSCLKQCQSNKSPKSTYKHMFYSGSNTEIVTIVGGTLVGALIVNAIHASKNTLIGAKKSQKHLIEEADALYDELNFAAIYDLLSREKNCGNDEILWRLARSTYEKSRIAPNNEAKKALLGEALLYLEEANQINGANFAVHKWLAIIMDCYYTLEGTKARISHLYEMKTHMEKACELSPKDGTSWYVLGMWYFGIANISWYERKAAAIFFATPPQASYDDALKVFLKAESVEPDFYSKNYLMIGKCLYYLGRKEEAKDYFTKAKNFVGNTLDDQEARSEAETWLRSL